MNVRRLRVFTQISLASLVLFVSLIKASTPVFAVSCPNGVGSSTYCKSTDPTGIYQCISDTEQQVGSCEASEVCQGVFGTPASCVSSSAPDEENQDTQIVDSLFLWQVNPLTINGNDNPFIALLVGAINVGQFSTPAGFLNALMPYLFSLAGMILFIMIVWGGFQMMMGAADTKAFDAGKQRVVAALIGFGLLFISYWIAQIVQVIFGVNILG